jgi:hypothetical protein
MDIRAKANEIIAEKTSGKTLSKKELKRIYIAAWKEAKEMSK